MRRWPPACLLLSLLPGIAAAGEPSAAGVGAAIAERRARVAELRLIREAAEELGVRVWLFGGTAAGFAHYVRSDLAREAGDARYRKSFFDYDFTTIYRSTQDADLVVDATPEQAARLENLIREKMSFLQGSKEHWEVRLLRQDRVAPGGQVKQALLANPDFLEQHTDSNSTGMIELTEPPPGETVVRDLRDWESPVPFFLQDLTLGRLHYYWSPTHQKTSRFLSGDNPPLFSVIRYLVKAFQYDLQIEGDDLQRVQAIIDAFDPEQDFATLSPWAKGWLERYGPNLVRHSVNIEQAWNTLERLGLRQKLLSLSDPDREGSLGWWLSREPLRTRQVGLGEGRTARDLRIEVVAHETRDFLAYESITRDTTLRPNVLISRPGRAGEAAAFGAGFYTRQGRMGARGTGLTIRFRVDPAAREGTDFSVHGETVVFHNRAALEVIPESLDLSLLEYFRMLRDGWEGIGPEDRGIWMKLRRRLTTQVPSGREEEELLRLLSTALEPALIYATQNNGTSILLDQWFDLPLSLRYPELVEQLIRRRPHLYDFRDKEIQLYLAGRILQRPGWSRHPELARRLLQTTRLADFALAEKVLSQEEWSDHPDLVETLLGRENRDLDLVIAGALRRPGWERHPQLARTLLERLSHDQSQAAWQQVERLLAQPQWHRHPQLIQELIDRDDRGRWTALRLLQGRGWEDHPELLLSLLAQAPSSWSWNLENLVGLHEWKTNPRLVELCGGRPVSLEALRLAPREGSAAEAARISADLADLDSSSAGECR